MGVANIIVRTFRYFVPLTMVSPFLRATCLAGAHLNAARLRPASRSANSTTTAGCAGKPDRAKDGAGRCDQQYRQDEEHRAPRTIVDAQDHDGAKARQAK